MLGAELTAYFLTSAISSAQNPQAKQRPLECVVIGVGDEFLVHNHHGDTRCRAQKDREHKECGPIDRWLKPLRAHSTAIMRHEITSRTATTIQSAEGSFLERINGEPLALV
jgi:hypothetical protein